jgi:hypothetical protein
MNSIEKMNEELFDNLALSDDELLLIKGGQEVNCGFGCGVGCGSGCGENCGGCTTQAETTLC